jgi:hypothetical protein
MAAAWAIFEFEGVGRIRLEPGTAIYQLPMLVAGRIDVDFHFVVPVSLTSRAAAPNATTRHRFAMTRWRMTQSGANPSPTFPDFPDGH